MKAKTKRPALLVPVQFSRIFVLTCACQPTIARYVRPLNSLHYLL
uniref:Uncharacterized protein n=1 Tax=Siphoviridae sp. ctHjK2 TaxID=2827831 RepID=A0A8S5SQI9_9CAUD|nr:MAG TPA: hypothetical protein [Siphoviridae sp. ctHjK2]